MSGIESPTCLHRHARFRANGRGTTLIGLLVVIGIIAILISMLVPSLNRTMSLAASTVCTHSLREIGHGLTLYRVDSDGWLPTDLKVDSEPEEAVTASSQREAWFQKLVPTYLQDPLIMTCPKDPYRYRMVEASKNWNTARNVGDYASFGLNQFIMTAAGGRLADLDRHWPKRPLDTILLADLGPDSLRGIDPTPLSTSRGGPRRKDSMLTWNDGYSPLDVEYRAPWVTRRHGHGINMLTVAIGVRSARTEDVMRQPVRTYYEECRAGGCGLCNIMDRERPRILHYTFAKDRLYWWTGPVAWD